MKFRSLNFLTAVTLFGGLMVAVRLVAQDTGSGIATYDAPGAGTSAGFGTFPSSINDAGAITGYYTDANNVSHGFLRSPRGHKFITFDAPGAGTSATFGTVPLSINAAGAVTGHYTDPNNVNHGFLRSPQGDIVTFDVPGAGTAGAAFGTFPERINAAGAITGHYIDANNVSYGFLRSPEGEFTTFEAPGADLTAGSGNGTFPEGMNDAGTITGHDVGRGSRGTVNHGFVRSPEGEFTTFDVPGASTAPGDGTFPRGINTAGTVVGHYSDASKEVNRGFVRRPAGRFVTFQAPGADTTEGSGNGTFPEAINDAGVITGRYVDRNIVYHGFLRSPGGEFTTFDAPGASSALQDGTFPRSINSNGVIVGNYSAADKEVNRGFVRNR